MLCQVVERAQKEDLNKLVNYHVAFIRNGQGRVVTDVRHSDLITPRPGALIKWRTSEEEKWDQHAAN